MRVAARDIGSGPAAVTCVRVGRVSDAA
jgi:hypothetical protein